MNKSLVPPARLCGAAAGNFALRYIGKVCCLLLVRADYIRPRPRALPNGARGIAQAVTRHRPISKLKLKVESQTRGGGRTETKGRSRRCRGENRAAKRAGTLGCRWRRSTSLRQGKWPTRRIGSSVAAGNRSNGCHRAGWTCSAYRSVLYASVRVCQSSA